MMCFLSHIQYFNEVLSNLDAWVMQQFLLKKVELANQVPA